MHRNMNRGRGLVALVVGALSFAAAGCTPDPGPKEPPGKVTIACSPTEEWCAAMTSAFTKKTGIKATFVRMSSGEAYARIKAGKNNPEFDVWHGGPADGYQAASDAGLLTAYASPNAASIPAKYKDPSGVWTGVYVGVLGFCSNTKVLAERHTAAPASWAALLDPALRRQVGIAHPATSGTAYTALWTQVTLAGGSTDRALDYMRRLHPNVLQYSKVGAAPAQQVARGEVGVAVVFAHDCIATQEQGFKDLTVTYPSEGTGYEVGGVAMIKGAHNSENAKKYIDWALTAEAQEIGPTARSYQTPTHPQAHVSPKSVPLTSVKLVDYDIAAAGKAKPVLTERFDKEIAPAPKS